MSGCEGWRGCEGCERWEGACVYANMLVTACVKAVGRNSMNTDSPSFLPTCYHGYCEDGRREDLELGLITSLGDGVDEITESRYQGNCQQNLEGEIHV